MLLYVYTQLSTKVKNLIWIQVVGINKRKSSEEIEELKVSTMTGKIKERK